MHGGGVQREHFDEWLLCMSTVAIICKHVCYAMCLPCMPCMLNVQLNYLDYCMDGVSSSHFPPPPYPAGFCTKLMMVGAEFQWSSVWTFWILPQDCFELCEWCQDWNWEPCWMPFDGLFVCWFGAGLTFSSYHSYHCLGYHTCLSACATVAIAIHIRLYRTCCILS
jgi:hypothetical protein